MTSSHIRQILLPDSRQEGGYVSVSPVNSLGLVDTFRKKSFRYAEKCESLYKLMRRVAGGFISNCEISYHQDSSVPEALYIENRETFLCETMKDMPECDVLDVMLDLFFKDKGVPLQNGYAYLETPKKRSIVRSNEYKHAWVEALYIFVQCSSMSDHAWWSRVEGDDSVYWRYAFKLAFINSLYSIFCLQCLTEITKIFLASSSIEYKTL